MRPRASSSHWRPSRPSRTLRRSPRGGATGSTTRSGPSAAAFGTRRWSARRGRRHWSWRGPAGFKPTDQNIDRLWKFFEWAHRDRLRFGWDPRGPGWTDEIVGRICAELSLTHVVDPFARNTMRGRPPYFRLHGITGHGHRYTDDELSRLRGMCSGEVTYCMFNNAFQADDARRFLELAGHAVRAWVGS
ncbi:MAG: DUF72 domain-containing protein [Planctomycetota bacterium]